MHAFRSRLLTVFFVVATAVAARGQTVLHHWRGGENDSGASAGGGFTWSSIAVDAGSGGIDLSFQSGSGTFSSDTAFAGSTLSYNLAGSAYFAGYADSSLHALSSFVMEFWFKPTSTGGLQIPFYNGGTIPSGIGFRIDNGTLNILVGGQHAQAIGTPTVGQWNYAALVFDNGSLKGFLNSTTPSYTGSGWSFNDPDGLLLLGANQDGDQRFSGLIDDARILTFASNNFSPSMLSYSAVPEPSTYAIWAGAGALGVALWRRRRASRNSQSPAPQNN